MDVCGSVRMHVNVCFCMRVRVCACVLGWCGGWKDNTCKMLAEKGFHVTPLYALTQSTGSQV